MASHTQTYYPTRSRGEYERKYPNAGVLLDLEEKFANLPGSKWRTEHLIACRLIQVTGGKILPILQGLAPEPCDLEQNEEWPNIKPLVDGPGDLRYKSRWELERETGNLGTLWSALAKCMAPREAGQVRDHPQRERRRVRREGFVSSDDLPISSSSSEGEASAGQRATSSQSSQQSFEISSQNCGEIDEDEHENRTKSEVITVNLAGAFIRYVLNFCAGQSPAKKEMLEFREEPNRVRHNLPKLRIDATDDGGIWVVKTQHRGRTPWLWESRTALLEAKRAFQQIDDNNRPVVSDANLAQYTCEALTAALGNPNQNEVFVITMTQTFMRFLHFNVTEEYIKYLHCNDAEKQKALHAYLYTTETEFFSLESKDGRRYALCNLLGLVKFWEKNQSQQVEGMDDIEGSGEHLGGRHAGDEPVQNVGHDNIDSDLEGNEEGDSETDTDDNNDEVVSPKKRKRCSS